MNLCGVSAQAFTFECVCGYLTEADSNCDVCTSGQQSRFFRGLLIYKDSVAFKWIEQPYTIIQNFDALTFRELIPNGEQIRIALVGTQFDSIQHFRDSVMCPCSGTTTVFVAGPGIIISGDTISAVDTTDLNEIWTISDNTDFEAIAADTVYFVGAGATTADYNPATNTLTITTPAADGSETAVTAGTGISVTGSGTAGDPYVVTNTGDLSATNEAWTVDADDADTELITTQTVKFEGAGITVTDYIPASDILRITSTEVDGSTTNEAWTIDADAGDTELINTQTVLFAGGGINSTNYDAGANTLTITGTEVDGDVNNEIQTLTAGGSDPSMTLNLSVGGGTVTLTEGTDIDLDRTGNTITINSTASGGITTADNGLYVSGGTEVRIGGTLIEATQIDNDGYQFRHFGGGWWSFSSYAGGAMTPSNAFAGFAGLESLPTINTSPTKDAIIEFHPHDSGGGNESNALSIGGYPTNNDGMWIQARSRSNPSFEYPLSLQPRGGQMSVGRLGGLDALVTFAGLGLTGSGVSGSVLHLENSEGNGKVAMSMGGGTDFMDSEVAWFDATDALRITNRSSSNNTSSIRFAIGGETNDLATLVKSSNGTSLVKLGVGVGNPANIHSTIQSAGGYAGRVLTTVGSFTLDESNYVVIYTSSGSVTWTLPTASTCTGREYILCSRGTGTVNLSVSVSKGNTGTFNSLSAGQWAHIWSDGSGWTGFKLTSE